MDSFSEITRKFFRTNSFGWSMKNAIWMGGANEKSPNRASSCCNWNMCSTPFIYMDSYITNTFIQLNFTTSHINKAAKLHPKTEHALTHMPNNFNLLQQQQTKNHFATSNLILFRCIAHTWFLLINGIHISSENMFQLLAKWRLQHSSHCISMDAISLYWKITHFNTTIIFNSHEKNLPNRRVEEKIHTHKNEIIKQKKEEEKKIPWF